MFNTGDLHPMESGAGQMSQRISELAKNFLSALFMGLRTAKIHSENNKAYDSAVRTLYDASRALHAATGGFRIVFVGDTILVNDRRLRLDSAAFSLMRSLRANLEGKNLGGLGVEHPPTFESSRALLELFRHDGDLDAKTLARAQVVAIGPQAYTDDLPVHVDPAEKAVRAYAKLLLAIRHQLERISQGDEEPASREVRLVRTVQDIIEVGMEVPQVMLRLVHGPAEAYESERHGANVCVLSVCLGHCLGLDRPHLVDLGVGAALHHAGVSNVMGTSPGVLDEAAMHRSFLWTLSETVVSTSLARRSLLLGNCRKPASGPQRGLSPGLLPRMVGLSATYVQLVSGFGLKRAMKAHPLDVCTLLHRDASGRFDSDLTDLLLNLLRVFPVGVEVVLASGSRAVVIEHDKKRPWDRPVVQCVQPRAGTVDLLGRADGGWVDSILGTSKYVGSAEPVPAAPPRPEPAGLPPAAQAAAARPAGPLTADLDTLDQGGHPSLQSLPPAAEDLLKDFLDED